MARTLSSLMRIAPMLVVAALFASTPLGALAEGEDPMAAPSLTCTSESLPVRAFELTAARITCRVTGAPTTDTTFTVSMTAADEAAGLADTTSRPWCAGSLSDGEGTCTGLARDGASIMQGRLTLTARLDPSGTVVNAPPPVPLQQAQTP